MIGEDWNRLFMAWDWILWIGFICLLISNIGSWSYAFRLRHDDRRRHKDAIDLLNEKYTRGEILRDEYYRKKNDILASERRTDFQKRDQRHYQGVRALM